VDARRKGHYPEVRGREEIVLTALIHDPELVQGFGPGIGQNFVDLPRDQIDTFVVAGFHADGVPTGTGTSLADAHSSR
jgi:hypothetical protein